MMSALATAQNLLRVSIPEATDITKETRPSRACVHGVVIRKKDSRPKNLEGGILHLDHSVSCPNLNVMSICGILYKT